MLQSLPDSPRTDQTAALMIAVGAVYLTPILLRDLILGTAGFPAEVTGAYLSRFGTAHVLASLGLRVPALVSIWLLWRRYPQSRLRASLGTETLGTLAEIVALSTGMTFALNLFGVWPFMWRWASDSTSAYVGALVSSGQGFAVALWTLQAVVVGPLIEELVFRFGVLQAVNDWTGSRAWGVFASSTAFALGHLGYLPPDRAHVINASWLFAASLILGTITLRRAGRITLSLSAHASRNALEVLLLLALGRRHVG